MNRVKPSYIFWGALIAGIALRFVIIFQPETNLLTRWGSDDLYYYSQIAGHVANGDGFTFDGVHATNGFQPLFLAVLIPFGSFLLNDWYASWVIVSLIVTIISMLAFFQLRKLASEMGLGDWLSVILPAVFFLHPKIVSVTFNGTEGALSFLMIVLSLRAFFWMKKGEHFWQSLLVFSLLVITRMEFSLFLFFLFVFAMFKRQDLTHWLKVAIGPVIVFGSWLLINYTFFGNIVPSSGQAKAIHGEWYEFSLFQGIKGATGTLLYAESGLSVVVIGLISVGLYSVWKKGNETSKQLMLFLAMSSSVLLIITLVQLKGFRDWYLMPQYLLVLLLMTFGIEWFLQSKKSSIVLLPFFLLILWGEAQLEQRTFNGQFIIQSCERVKSRFHQTEEMFSERKVGAFNAGLPATCFGEEYCLVNLDGVVNNGVLPYLKAKKLEKYMAQKSIVYVLDNDASINFFHEKGAGPGRFDRVTNPTNDRCQIKYWSLVSLTNWL